MSLVAGNPSAARAQGFASRSLADYGVSPSLSYSSGGTSYLPFGGGGFVPYSGGPGGGLGVQPRMAGPSLRSPLATAAMGGMAGSMGPSLGQVRSSITPLSPIRVMSGGRGGGMAGGAMIQRASNGGGMGGMSRPPVGSYPFRQPPSLTGPASQVMSMSM
jgi:hypothetical protein